MKDTGKVFAVREVDELELIRCTLEDVCAKLKSAAGYKPALLDVEGAAQYLGLSVPYLNNLRRGVDGPPYIKIGDLVRYHVDDLNAWIKSRERRGRK